MERDELETIITDTSTMVNNLMYVNLEVWVTKREQLEEICKTQDERGLLALHEDVAVRLMSALN